MRHVLYLKGEILSAASVDSPRGAAGSGEGVGFLGGRPGCRATALVHVSPNSVKSIS